MATQDTSTALETARRIVLASSADETEVSIDDLRERFVRFANNGPTQNADRQRVDVSIRVRLKDGDGYREARATSGSLAEADTRRALARALELAGVSPANADLVPMGGAVEVRPTVLDEATLGQSFEEKAAWVKRAVDACRSENLRPAGLLATTGAVHTIVNSSGREVQGASTRAGFALTASSERGAGWGEQISGRIEEIDAERVVRRAVDKAIASRAPEAIDPGEYTVILEPAAVSALLLFASYRGFGAREVMEESSFLCGRQGEALFPEALSLADDAGNAVYAGLPFDGEGTPKSRVELIARGRLGGPVTDLNTATKLGVPCTGHSLPQPNTHGPMARNLVLAGGGASREELLSGVERGLLVTQFHYTNVIEPRELTLTGMTRNGTFLVENGEVTRAVKNLRFTQSLVGALQNVSAVGDAQEVAGALFDGEIVTPALRVDGFRFTSATDF